MTTLQQAIASIKGLKKTTKASKKKFATELLGKYKGITPSAKSSTEVVRELRRSLHGKVKA